MKGLRDYLKNQQESKAEAERIHEEVKAECDKTIPEARQTIIDFEAELQNLNGKFTELEAKKSTEENDLAKATQLEKIF